MVHNPRKALQAFVDLPVDHLADLSPHLLLCLENVLRIRVIVIFVGFHGVYETVMTCPSRPWELLFLVEVKVSLLEWVSNRLERQCSFVELLWAEFDPLGCLEYGRGGSRYPTSAELLHLHWDALDLLVGGWLESPRRI